MKALVEKDERGVVGFVWKAAAELEYALRGSQTRLRNKSDPPCYLPKTYSRKPKSYIDVGELGKAHKKTWMARGHLLEVWKRLTAR